MLVKLRHSGAYICILIITGGGWWCSFRLEVGNTEDKSDEQPQGQWAVAREEVMGSPRKCNPAQKGHCVSLTAHIDG